MHPRVLPRHAVHQELFRLQVHIGLGTVFEASRVARNRCGQGARCCSRRFLAYLGGDSKPFSCCWSRHMPWMICKARGMNSYVENEPFQSLQAEIRSKLHLFETQKAA